MKETQISSPHTLQTHTFRATQLEEGNVKSNLHLHVKFENSRGQRSMCKDGGRETMKPRQIITNSVKGLLPFHNKVEDHDRWNMKCQFRFSFKNGKWQKHYSYFFNLSPPSELCNNANIEKYNFHRKRFEQVPTARKWPEAAVLLYLSETDYSTAGQDAEYSEGAGTGQANKQPHNSLLKENNSGQLSTYLLVHLFALRGCFTWFSSWLTFLWWNWLYLGNIKGVN